MSLETINTEQILLLSVMNYPGYLDIVGAVLSENDFSCEQHSTIWKSIKYLDGIKRPFDIVSVMEHVKAIGELDSIGGEQFFNNLEKNNYASSDDKNVTSYAKYIRQVSVIRCLRDAAHSISELAHTHGGRPLDDILSEAESILQSVIAIQKSDDIEILDGKQMMDAVIADYVQKAENPGICGISTGIQVIDEKTDGLHRGDMVIVAGPPSMGKTTFAVNLLQNALMTTELPVVLFSMEMPAKDIGRRMWSTASRVEYKKIRHGKVDDVEGDRMFRAVAGLSSPLLKVTGHSPLTPGKIRMVLKKLARKHGGIQMAMVDYVQLMECDGKQDNRNNELTIVSRELKRMAMEFNMPFIVLSQLTKAVETQRRRPTNGDLRESGAFAQDADMILMVHRQEKYDEDNQEHQGKAEIIVTKNRNGETGTVLVGFDGPTFRFYELNGGQSWQQ